ncbi:MAG: hypothetical protein WD314_01155 [Trueperaceae bacterium]
MNSLRALTRQLASPEAQQYLALYLIALLFALLASWPTTGSVSNDSWFSLAYTRAAGIGLLGIGFGINYSRAARQEKVLVAAMLGCFALLALPLELAAYAASYPTTPVAWFLALPPLSALAMFAVGLLLGGLLGLVRLRVLAPVIVPAALVGMVAFDVAAGLNILNPFTGAVRVSWYHLATLLSLAALLLLVLLRPSREVGS